MSDFDPWRCSICWQHSVVPSLAAECCAEWKADE